MTDNVLFHVIYGSYAHGTSTDISDCDERIIFFNTKPYEIKDYYSDGQKIFMDFSFFMRNCIRCVPFELELLYINNNNLFKKPLPFELEKLALSYPFVSKYLVSQYLMYAEWKFRQSQNGTNKKYAYQSIRMLLEAKNILINNSGPIVNVNDNKEYLMKIKCGEYNIVEDYGKLVDEVKSLPNNLKRQPDVAAIVQTQNLIIQKYRKV